MKTKLHANGSLILPESYWLIAGIPPGSDVEVSTLDVGVMIRRAEATPAKDDVRLERRGRILVAVPDGVAPTLTVEIVDQVLEEIRAEREQRFAGTND